MSGKVWGVIILTAALTACVTTNVTLYQQLGGDKKVELIVDNFIEEIQFNKKIFQYFTESDVDRFREKLIEHICVIADGNCQYTGDTMQQVHEGMNITETDFNTTVDLLISAMTKADVPHRIQNQLLQRLAKLRHEILYL
ncbi:group 1 truncated hemoglobin [Psychrosphaera sp. B3R10]|uniref:group I truncated hemoglobin n=2 Tax=Psychrosphaera TaxID=907197 RepID=UPI001C08127A|nr:MULTISPECIES: group 1 truncated hemoglobin [unclassified Psychrosphaera]MBU2880847.1 group 1 truncated hemoglobin [Psychrosphaera sp. I2R16]MBU2990934.1 group 1 truncated hemoglobin [Psychrosphaera sp. B3R10]